MQSFNDVVDEFEQVKRQLGEQRSQAAELRSALAQREEQISARDSIIQVRTAELSRVLANHGRLRGELAQVKSGRLWKATSFLRPSIRRSRRQLRRDMKLLKQSDLFDDNWYLSQNPDVAASGQNPLQHYLEYGGWEGRDPSPAFSSQQYLDNNADVLTSGINPLVHYLRFGKQEGRTAVEP
jgi:hypothetical protein